MKVLVIFLFFLIEIVANNSPRLQVAQLDINPRDKIIINLDETNTGSVNFLNALYVGEALVGCSNDTNVSFTIFTFQIHESLSDFLVYDGSDLTVLINSLDQINSTIFSTTGCLSIFRQSANHLADVTAYFTINKVMDENCQGPNTFLDPKSENSTKIIAESMPKNACEIFIVPKYVEHFPYVQSIWISAITTNADTLKFKSAVNGKLLFNLSISELPYWKNIGIYTEVLSITLPPGSEVTLEMAEGYYTENFEIKVNEDDLKGIMESPSYSGQNQNVNVSQELYRITSEQPTSLTLHVKTLNSDGILYFLNYPNNLFQYLRHNQTLNLTVTNFQLFFTQRNADKDYFIVEYFIKGIPNLWTTTDGAASTNIDGNSSETITIPIKTSTLPNSDIRFELWFISFLWIFSCLVI